MKDLGKYYKSKYLALRAQYIKTIDFAFREGYVKGQSDAQLQLMQQQLQEAQMQQMQQAQAAQQQAQQAEEQQPQEPGGNPEQEMSPEEAAQMQSQEVPPEGAMYDKDLEISEINELIGQLQEAIQKSEVELPSLQKSLDTLNHIKSQKKSMSYANNLNPAGKLALSEQERLVENLVKKWDSESSGVASEILSSLRSESLK